MGMMAWPGSAWHSVGRGPPREFPDWGWKEPFRLGAAGLGVGPRREKREGRGGIHSPLSEGTWSGWVSAEHWEGVPRRWCLLLGHHVCLEWPSQACQRVGACWCTRLIGSGQNSWGQALGWGRSCSSVCLNRGKGVDAAWPLHTATLLCIPTPERDTCQVS